MPQPLSRVKGGRDAEIFTDAADLPPALCVQITRVITAWAHIDQILTDMLAGFLDADFGVVAAMYKALASADAKRAAIIGAAKQARPDQSILLQAVLNTTKSYRSRRNDFAHHIWATSPQISKAMILIDPAVFTEQMFALHQMASRGWLKPKSTRVGKGVVRLDLPQVPAHDRSRMFVWKEKELREAATDALTCVNVFKLLAGACGRLPSAEAQQQLLSVPLIQQEFERLTSGSAQ